MSSDIKNVDMEVSQSTSEYSTRKRRKRRTAHTKTFEDSEGSQITKQETRPPHTAPSHTAPSHTAHSAPSHTAPSHTAPSHTAPSQQPTQQPKPVAKVVIAPPKKRPAKLLLVAKPAKLSLNPSIKEKIRTLPKTFRAKHVKITVDNTARTRKHRRSIVTAVDNLTDEQIRAAAVRARLSRKETVDKAPIQLLRQMIKDYQAMKGMLM